MTTNYAPATDLTVGLEQTESRAWGDLYRYASPAAEEVCGLDRTRFGSADAVVAAGVDVLTFNRVIGLGAGEPVGPGTIDGIAEFFQSAGARRFFVQIAPGSSIAQTPELLEQRGFRHYNNWVKLYRPVGEAPAARTDLRIERIDAQHAGAFGAIAASCLGWPAYVGPWVGCLVGQPDWLHYMAFDGDEPVATSALRVCGEFGWLDFTSTLPEYRGRGAQGAMLVRRINDAAARGCRHLVVETAEGTPERPSPSYRNTLRYGFQPAYIRPNYLFEA